MQTLLAMIALVLMAMPLTCNWSQAAITVCAVLPDVCSEAGVNTDAEITPEKAEIGIEALFRGDYETAALYVCDEVIQEAQKSLGSLPEGTKISVDATCSNKDETMSCSMTLTVSMKGTEPTTQELPAQEVPIEDGKLCEF